MRVNKSYLKRQLHRKTHTITVTDGNGNKEKITIRIGKWVKGSETELLDKAWKIVGGTGAMPLVSGKYSDAVLTLPFNSTTAVYVFGTVSLENMTPDFSAGNGHSQVDLQPQIPVDSIFKSQYYINVVKGRQYSTGAKCDGGTLPLIVADMKSNNWGPCAFVIGVDNIFTPNFPEGIPQLNDVYFFVSSPYFPLIEGDAKFQIGKSW
jgi:hypothetical protein